MKKKIICIGFYENEHEIPVEKIRNRIAAYIILFDKKMENIAVQKLKNGKYTVPGGEKESHETIEEALHRELKEECNVSCRIVNFLTLTKNFFYYEPADDAINNISLFYVGIIDGDDQFYFDNDRHDDPMVETVWIPKNMVKEFNYSFDKMTDIIKLAFKEIKK